MNEKKIYQKECPGCGKKINKAKVNFCSSCGCELFTPRFEVNWNYRVLTFIVIAIILLYTLYIYAKPVLYSYLDMV
jgi:predicted nucleic acid-binding Zn ribbon protein